MNVRVDPVTQDEIDALPPLPSWYADAQKVYDLNAEVDRLFRIRDAGGIRCVDKLCPWAAAPDDPDLEVLVKEHAAEHEGGRRSNMQAARQAEASRSLRHAGDRRWPEADASDTNGWTL